jgi:hypothetical protein
MLESDVDFILNDMVSLGLTVKALYRTKGQTEGGVVVTAAIEITGREHAEDLPGEVQRDIASITIYRGLVEDPEYQSSIVVESGRWAGEYVVYSWQSADDGAVVLDTRRDTLTRARGAGARRLAGGA